MQSLNSAEKGVWGISAGVQTIGGRRVENPVAKLVYTDNSGCIYLLGISS